MKTIAIFSGYSLPHLGGVEKYTDSITKEFVKLGYRVIIASSDYTFSNNYVKEEKDIVTIKLPVHKMFVDRYPIIKKNKDYKDIIKKLDDYNIDVIIVNTRFYLTSHVGANYGKNNGIPVYLIEHGSNYVTLDNKFIDFFANRYEDFLTWKIKKKIKGFYGVSNACGRWLKHFKIDAVGTWYNSIDTNQKLPIRKEHNRINFLYAGRLIKQKGVLNILDAFTNLEKKYKDISLYIAGDGPELEGYKNKFTSENIHFLGKLKYDELVNYYAITDVFLYPPLWPEGLPTSIVEAGLMKCSIIGTDQGGITEVISNNQNGLIVGTTMEALQDGMDTLISSKELRNKFSSNIYNTILDKFSWNVTAKKILKDIENI